MDCYNLRYEFLIDKELAKIDYTTSESDVSVLSASFAISSLFTNAFINIKARLTLCRRRHKRQAHEAENRKV